MTIETTTARAPAASWDGQSDFRDYHIRAKLWLATTKVRAKARGPMLLKSLSNMPFDDLKHLAQDAAWMNEDNNGELLLFKMDTKELYGEDAREDMLNTLVLLTLLGGLTVKARSCFSLAGIIKSGASENKA